MRQGRTMERKQGKWKKLEQSLTSVPNSPCGLERAIRLSDVSLPVCTAKQPAASDPRGPMHLLLSKLCIHKSRQMETP